MMIDDYEDDKLESEVEQSVSLKHGNTSSSGSDNSHGKSSAKILPSNGNTSKSTDTEGVERQLYLEDSSGAVFTPPEIDVLVGGKRKGRKVRNKRVKKKNKSKNDKVHGGCRVISTAPNKDKQRDCMKTAVESLLITTKEKELILCSSNPFPIQSDDGRDVSIEQGNRWLMEHGMILESVTDRYDKKHGLLYNLLQDLECRLVIKIVLTMCDGSGIANHFIAYDGTTLHDVPNSIKPSRDDRRKKGNCLAIFQKLYPREKYSAFLVTNVFELRTATATF